MLRRLAKWLRDENGAIAPILVLLLIPIIGMLSIGGEVAGWYMKQRLLQHAADSAALAAAGNASLTNVTIGGVTNKAYQNEAYSIAGQYGFKTNTSTTVTPETLICPGSTTATCFKVTISQKVPLYLTQVVGYQGTLNAGRMTTTVTAYAIASARVNNSAFCLLGLNKNVGIDALSFKGAPKMNLHDCDIKSNSNVSCNGQSGSSIGIPYAVGTIDNKCGSGASDPVTEDPFVSKLTGIAPTNAGCNTTGKLSAGAMTTSLTFCGDVTVQGNVDVCNENLVLTIYDGTLNVNGKTLKTLAGASALCPSTTKSSLSIVFTGATSTPVNKKQYYPTGTGLLDVAAPASGSFKGVALMQDPKLNAASELDLEYKGNGSNTTDLLMSGLIYFPHGTFNVKGGVGKSTTGRSCFAVVAYSIAVNGNGQFFNTDCTDYLPLPTSGGAGNARQALVQ